MAISWPENSPDKLEDICVQFCVEKLETFAVQDKKNGKYSLQSGLTLPKSLCDKLFKSLISTYPKDYHDKFSIFLDTGKTQISSLCLRKSHLLSDENLRYLENQPIVDLELSYCSALSRYSLKTINKLSRTLKLLRIEGGSILESDNYSDKNANAIEADFLHCPNLRVLCVHDFAFNETDDPVLSNFLPTLKQLTHLDLSSCRLGSEDVKSFQLLQSLVSLNLSNVIKGNEKYLFEYVCELKTLRHLDISVGVELVVPVIYNDPDYRLSQLVSCLPHLVSLDISGTNLSGFEKVLSVSHKLEAFPSLDRDEEKKCSIPGLQGKKLEFLGLLDCVNEPCERENLPAAKVTGHGSEDQVLLAVRQYQDRSSMLCSAFSKLVHLFQGGEVINQCEALQGLLDGMKRHPDDKHVQISGCASLFYIAKGEQKDNMTQKQKRLVLNQVLEAMENFSEDRTMMRNGCLTLSYFNLSQDVIYCYSRVSTVLLNMLQVDLQDDFIHRIGIHLLNCLACQVSYKQKAMVGELGAINVMLKIITKKLGEGECDDMMEMAWSSMWNITDETAINCEKFIDCDGMSLFLKCLEMFKDRAELLRNMMGLMGNIAEVKELRSKLMVSKYITVFSDLLNSTSDGIEVSYNAAGVLAHLASDGKDAWCIENPCREDVLFGLTSAIERWDITSKRNINYRSFEPILRLLVYFDTPQVQHWAIWALCNLTLVYPEKYCDILEKETGRSRLNSILCDIRTEDYMKDLINRILKHLQDYKEKPEDIEMENS